MKIDFELEFLYYQERAILDGTDPKMKELEPHIEKFAHYITTVPIKELLKLMIIAYKDRFGQSNYWADYQIKRNRLDYDYNFEYPEDLDEDKDLYMPTKVLERTDLQYIIVRKKLATKYLNPFLDTFEIAYKGLQPDFSSTVQEALSGKAVTKTVNGDHTIFDLQESPIARITLSNDKFIMKINPDYWKFYGGE